MPKRRAESSSSSSSSEWESSSTEESSKSSINDSSFTLSYGEAKKRSVKVPPANGKRSRKKTRNGSAEETETNLVASSSTQLQRELGMIVKGESDESEESERERERNEVTATLPERTGSASSSSGASHLQPHENYFEGCLVMGWVHIQGYPWWPGIIRKASPESDYFRVESGDIQFCVQYFTDPTTLYWEAPGDLRVFDPAEPHRCIHRDRTVTRTFWKGIRIAKAAANLEVEARLAKFTLPKDTGIDGLYREINEWNDPPSITSIIELVAGLKKQVEIQKNADREKEETNKAVTTENSKLTTDNSKLTTDNSKLTTDNSKLTEELEKVKAANMDLTLQLQSKADEKGKIENKLKAKDKLIAELCQEKLGYTQELEKLKSEVVSLARMLDPDMMEEGGTGT